MMKHILAKQKTLQMKQILVIIIIIK